MLITAFSHPMVATVGWLFCSFKEESALCKGGYKCPFGANYASQNTSFGANNGLKKVPFGASYSIFKGLFGAVWGGGVPS